MISERILSALQSALPHLMAVYVFGSRAQGTAGPASDLDVAVLVEGKLDPLFIWSLAHTVAELAGCEVDLIDFRAASTVMQYEIMTTGQRVWEKDARADLYECAVLSQKTDLDCARAALLNDIQREGRVYGSQAK